MHSYITWPKIEGKLNYLCGSNTFDQADITYQQINRISLSVHASTVLIILKGFND